MKEKTRKRIATLALIFCLCFLLGAAQPVAASSIPESDVPASSLEETPDDAQTPADADVPNTVIINLGPEWAATEFELASEAGTDPYMVRVSPEGTLTLDLDGSYIYTLTLDPERLSLGANFADDLTAADDSALNPESQQSDESEAKEVPEEEQNTLLPGIPNLHVFLFAGGLLICIGALVTMAVLKRRRENTDYDEEDDDDYDDE